jgi:hypothetical protein
MNYRSETTRLDFSRVFRKLHTKLPGVRAILTNFNDSQIFWLPSFLYGISLRGIFKQGKAEDSQKVAKLFAFLIAGYPLHTDPSFSHFRKASKTLSVSLEGS